MFKTSQIISATRLLREYKGISQYLLSYPQPLLITHKKGGHLVLVSAEIFEDLFERSLCESPPAGVLEIPECFRS